MAGLAGASDHRAPEASCGRLTHGRRVQPTGRPATPPCRLARLDSRRQVDPRAHTRRGGGRWGTGGARRGLLPAPHRTLVCPLRCRRGTRRGVAARVAIARALLARSLELAAGVAHAPDGRHIPHARRDDRVPRGVRTALRIAGGAAGAHCARGGRRRGGGRRVGRGRKPRADHRRGASHWRACRHLGRRPVVEPGASRDPGCRAVCGAGDALSGVSRSGAVPRPARGGGRCGQLRCADLRRPGGPRRRELGDQGRARLPPRSRGRPVSLRAGHGTLRRHQGGPDPRPATQPWRHRDGRTGARGARSWAAHAPADVLGVHP